MKAVRILLSAGILTAIAVNAPAAKITRKAFIEVSSKNTFLKYNCYRGFILK